MDHAQVWNDCLHTIRQRVDQQSFATWFEPIRPLALQDNELTIQVPHRLFYEWLEEHYLDVLKSSLTSALGMSGRLQYRINPERSAPPTLSGPQSTPSPAAPPRNIFAIPGVTRPRIESNVNPEQIFDNFIQGDCNSLARNAAKAVADNPTETAFNPLVIHGPTGLGKTHLLNAVGNYIQGKFVDKAVLYVSTNTFTNQLVNSIGSNATTELMNFYQNVDVLLVDDIHNLVGRKKTQDVFFNLFNVLRQQNKAVILTSDVPIKQLDIEERLRSRFQWGLSADLTTPALETRMAILASKANSRNVQLDPTVMEFICTHIRSNIRQLESVLTNLSIRAGVNPEGINIDLAREVMENFVSELDREITPEIIRRTVAEHYGVELANLESKTRKRPVVLARQISMFLMKEHTTNSLKAIGRMFGGRDHSTVLYSINTVKDLMSTSDEVRGALEELERKIRVGTGV